MSLAGYNPLKVVGAFGTGVAEVGSIDIMDGLVDGNFLNVVRDNANWVREYDLQGNATRVRMNNTGGTFTLNVSASSKLNDKLSAAVAVDELSENVVGTLTLNDLNGTSKIILNGAYLEGVPTSIAMGNTRGEHAWVFHFASAKVFLGGRDTVG